MVLDICGKRTYEYIFESLAKLNRQENITLRAIGGNVSKGMGIASILSKLNIDVENIKGRFNNEVQHFRKQERKRYTKVLWKRDISI